MSRTFLDDIIEKDLAVGGRCHGRKEGERIITRFPPEPNGYLHIGHAKSICLNFGLAKKYGGRCHLRFDDTNPKTESDEYVNSIKNDVKWLGFDWGEHCYFASDYFDQLYEWALHLIREGKAYVCDLSKEEFAAIKGSIFEPGTNSPFRIRSVEENLVLFEKMRNGETPEGKAVLRAKIDMAHPNVHMRDPPLYRIVHASHHNTGDKWKIYPMYDYAHGQEDAIEHITHSICTLEFKSHRDLYFWFLENLPVPAQPIQYEFARLNVTNTVMSKRKLLRLVKEGVADGWDDPRMPTICGMRRRGIRPEALRNFCERIGVTAADSMIDSALLDECAREDLEPVVPRRMAVLQPLKVVIETLPADACVTIEVPNHPAKDMGSRALHLTREIFIEREDFRETTDEEYYRLKPGCQVKLRHGYVIKCEKVIKDEKGDVIQVICSHDAESLTSIPKGLKGVVHWVSAPHSVSAKIALLNPLVLEDSAAPVVAEDGEEEKEEADWMTRLNPDSKIIHAEARLEASMSDSQPGDRFQFERVGYFVHDSRNKGSFIRTVGLKESGLKKEENKTAAARSRKDEQAAQKAAKDALRRIKPEDLFRNEKYSKWDEKGIPTHDAEGNEVSKNASKKLAKEWEAQAKLYDPCA